MVGTEPALRPAETSAAGVGKRAVRRSFEVPIWAAAGACLVLAIISAIVLTWPPSSDPWAWIDWGQEIASHVVGTKIALSLTGGPSWKPFPVVFTSIFGLFGGAGPHMWLVVARTAGLLALVAAFRLGNRFAGPVAGLLAAVALWLTQDWMFYMARGASEPIVACLTLWAVDRHLVGSPRVAYILGVLAALNRPEFVVFLAPYALYLWLRVPRSRALVAAGIVLIGLAWLAAPAIISGNAFQATTAAAGGKGSPGSAIAELKTGVTLLTVPTLVLGAVGLALAYTRGERILMWLGVGALAWAVMVALMTQVFYGLPRYLLPAGTIACVLAGVAVVRLAELGAARARGPSWVPLAVGALIVAITLPWTVARGKVVVRQARQANQAAYFQKRLFLAADRVGGRHRVLPCRTSVLAINHSLASAIAWKLKVPLRRVRPSMRGTGFVFSAPRNSDTGTTPPIRRVDRQIRTIAVLPPWLVLEVTRKGASATPHCSR